MPSVEPVRFTKTERRAYYRRLLESFSSPHFQDWNQKLGPRLLEVARKIPPQSFVTVYNARPKEANLSALFELPLCFCFPRVLSEDGQMEFRWVKDVSDQGEFELGPYGILEPKKTNSLVAKEDVHTCFIPLLAFDKSGRRLGNGHGFYDRFLNGFSGLKVGVGFEWQCSLTPLPEEAHDQRLDIAITEWETRNFRKVR